jgi:hypothetical protein
MKTFLQICLDAWEESGLSGTGPSDVTKATGIQKRMVGWVRQSWIDIQQFRSDWPWMYKPFSFNTSANKQSYPLTELNLTDVERWIFKGASIYKTADGVAGEQDIGALTYEIWWINYRKGLQIPAMPGRLFFDPVDNSLMVFPVPEDEYTIVLRYYKAPQRLAINGDIPTIPTNEAWQEIIKWRALYLYAFHDGAPALLDEAEFQYDEMITAMDNRYGQAMNIVGRPIA